jgi:NAD(P)-dependent dehydrogenase (short-subunit alcohol dehydrogenase family)
MGLLDGKVAIVTGAAKGFGLATSKAFVKEGAKVVMTDVDDKEGQKQADQLGNNAIFIKQDVSKEDEWPQVFEKAEQTFGPVNILLNNAGILLFDNAESFKLDDFHKILSVDLDGVAIGQKYGIQHMKEHGGSIINLCSIAGLIGISNLFSYNAAKGAVRLITKSAALYCCEKKYPIRVNSVHPGYAHTPMVDAYPEMRESLEALHPMGRLGSADEIANMCVFLASDKSSFSTGSEFVTDGGYTAQ